MIYDIGTRVRIKSDGADAKVKIVHEVAATPEFLHYAVSGSAWHEHDDLEFVEGPTVESLREASHWYDDADENSDYDETEDEDDELLDEDEDD